MNPRGFLRKQLKNKNFQYFRDFVVIFSFWNITKHKSIFKIFSIETTIFAMKTVSNENIFCMHLNLLLFTPFKKLFKPEWIIWKPLRWKNYLISFFWNNFYSKKEIWFPFWRNNSTMEQTKHSQWFFSENKLRSQHFSIKIYC